MYVPTLHPIGDIFSDIFGTSGSKFAKQVDGDDTALFKNEEHSMQLLKNNTSVLDTTIDIVKQADINIQKHSAQINKLFEYLKQ